MNKEDSVVATKAVSKVKISNEYRSILNEQKNMKLIADNVRKGLDSFDLLYNEIERCFEKQMVTMNGGKIFYYPELNLIIPNKEPVELAVDGIENDKSRKELYEKIDSYLTSEELLQYGKKIEMLNDFEAEQIFMEYKKKKGATNYKHILCKDKNDTLLVLATEYKKIMPLDIANNIIAGIAYGLVSYGLYHEMMVSNARLPVCIHLPINMTKLAIALKYNLDESQLSEPELFLNLKMLYDNKYVTTVNKKIVLTKEGKEAINKKKIKQIGSVSIHNAENDKKEDDTVQKKINLKNISIKEKKIIFADYLKCDKYRANLREYDLKCLEDPNMGHWELWDENKKTETISFCSSDKVYARNPIADIKSDSVIGIDFGTKSTVVVYQDESGNIKPMPIGCGDARKELTPQDFENPTVMQFIDFDNFMKCYNEKKGRPYTRWRDITVSHTANESMKDSTIRSDEYYSYMYDLKQWAGEGNQKKIIHDKSGKDIFLDEYQNIIEKEEKNLDPIELYAYYIGLYINNMNNGIYLDYILSFPVTYEKKIRNAILTSFSNGLKKSLPESILKNKEIMKKFNVEAGTSEPAAYAICALEKYGFEPEKDEKVFYGIFDFGGGTADFDFGLWSASKNQDVYDYCIEHFGSEGDRYLGGENLLQLIAFEVFKENIDVCRENDITFGKPNEIINVPVELNGYVKDSQEARMNLKIMMEKLRPFWEINNVETDSDNKKSYSEFQCGLFNSGGEYKPNLALKADTAKLEKILTDRIEKGVRQFFNALKETFSEKYFSKTAKIDKINIFLAGNSSKSPILNNVFKKNINEWSDKILKKTSENKEFFKLYPPLGCEQAKAIQKENDVFEDGLEEPTGKTGVAWGLIEGRKGGRIEIKEEITYETEAKFAYYLGISVRKKFNTKIARDAAYNKWYRFVPALKEKFEIYYTSLPEATNGKLSERDENVMRKRLDIDECGEGLFVYIRLKTSNMIEYALGDNHEKIKDETIKQVIL